MPYTPNNVQVYTAAFTGCVAGMTANRRNVNSTVAAYNPLMLVADAWAQAVDGLWVGTPSQLDIDNIYGIAQAEFFNRAPNPASEPHSAVASTYSAVAMALLAAVTAAQNRFAAEGITPPPAGGGSGGGSWLGTATFDFAAHANHITLSTNDVKNAALHFEDTASSGGPYKVTFPVPGSDAAAYTNSVLNDVLDTAMVIELGPGGITTDIPAQAGKVMTFEPSALSGFYQNLNAPFPRSKFFAWGPGSTKTLNVDDIQASVIHLTSTAVAPIAQFPKVLDDAFSYTIFIYNDGANPVTIEYDDATFPVSLPANTSGAVTFETSGIKAAVTGSVG